MKKLGYRLFAFVYYIACMIPTKKNHVFCVMTHDASAGGNVGMVVNQLKQMGGYTFSYLTKKDREIGKASNRIQSMIEFFIKKPFELARAEYVLMDNTFLPMAYIKFRKKVKVVQLWHGTGTIKKFGQSCNEGELLRLEKRADQTITHLIINSDATRKIYKEAFGMNDERVYELGLPRTDLLFDKSAITKMKRRFFQSYPELVNKKMILYAPTFRDDQIEHPQLGFDVESVLAALSDEYVIGLRVHPFVAKNYEKILNDNSSIKNDSMQKKLYDFSMYEDLNTLLCVSDCLITDYSSIIFEYCVLEKPMIFYAYDYQEFYEDSRGFYDDYKTFVPGPVAYTQQELLQLLCNWTFDIERVKAFKSRQYKYTDGRSTERLIQTVFSD